MNLQFSHHYRNTIHSFNNLLRIIADDNSQLFFCAFYNWSLSCQITSFGKKHNLDEESRCYWQSSEVQQMKLWSQMDTVLVCHLKWWISEHHTFDHQLRAYILSNLIESYYLVFEARSTQVKSVPLILMRELIMCLTTSHCNQCNSNMLGFE